MNVDFAWRAIAALGVCALVWLSLTPDPLTLADLDDFEKLQHVAAYAVLAWWIGQLDDGRRVRDAAATLLLLGVLLEIAQLGVERREFSSADIAANAIGIAIGSFLAPPRGPRVLATIRARRARARDTA